MAPILFASRGDWADLVPVPQEDLPDAPAAIAYSARYKDAMDYFRGVVAVQDRSERVLELTEAVIKMNPAHYTVWRYRFETLLHLKADLREELELMQEFSKTFMKNYQIWHHRQSIIESVVSQLQATSSLSEEEMHKQILDLVQNEIALTTSIFDEDEKNYHTWAYRQWVLSYAHQHLPPSSISDILESEAQYTLKLIDADLLNNSAWNHRYFVLIGHPQGALADRDTLDISSELRFVEACIDKAPNNESAWNYLRGIMEYANQAQATLLEFVLPLAAPTDESARRETIVKTASLPAALAVEFLADIKEEQGKTSEAKELFQKLADELDAVRKSYWHLRIAELNSDKEAHDNP